ncbi:MAG TPA: DUF1206 domain-containing protein, partial [Tepidisphaeraceae bacterium]
MRGSPRDRLQPPRAANPPNFPILPSADRNRAQELLSISLSMSTLSHKIDSLQRDAKQAVRKASPWIGFLARFGFATRGLLYVILGALALLYAIGHGGKTTNVRGAMYTLFHQPLGTILLLGACIGLAGYALWSFIQALLDPDHFGSSFKGLARRFGCFCTGCIYGALLCA